MQILDSIVSPGPDIFYEPKFRNVLEDHMTFLREHPDNYVVAIEASIAVAYVGDLYGALGRSNVPAYLHWLVMRMNNMVSPTDYRDDMLAVIVPPARIVEQLRAAHRTQNNLKK